MIVISVTQGTQEWLDARAKHFTASEASVMMGTSKKATRNDLLRMKATGDEQEFSRWVKEVLFERGHEVEAKARPIAEKIVGEELYPATATDDDGYLLASFDGITMADNIVWECKQWNEEKAAAVHQGRCPDEDYWQVVQQLAVSGADRCLYMVTDGTEENTLHVWVDISLEDIQRLHDGWAQFAADLKAYEPAPDAEPAVQGRAPDQLPRLHIEVQGMVTASNLEQFKEHALSVFGSINTDLQDDQDFASAEQTVKWCKDVEERLDAAKDHALAQTASIDDLFRAIDSIKDEARAKRLELDKLVKARKQAIRDEILWSAKQAYQKHIGDLEQALEQQASQAMRMDRCCPEPDIAGAMKGKKTVKSLRDAADQAVANAKLDAHAVADRIRANLTTFADIVDDHHGLFPDLATLVAKDGDDFTAVVKARVSDHKDAEEKRMEAERARIREEEQRKAEAAARKEQAAATPEPAAKPEPAKTVSAPPKAARKPMTLRDEINLWAEEHDISHQALGELLDLMGHHIDLQSAA